MRVYYRTKFVNEYIIPHFRVFVKLKHDFNRFPHFFKIFLKKLDLTVGRGPVPRVLSLTVGRLPVPRERSITVVCRARLPDLAPVAIRRSQSTEGARAGLSLANARRIPGTAGDRPPPYGNQVQPPVGQARLILPLLRSGERNLQRGRAGACPSRTRGVSRARRGTGPRPTAARRCSLKHVVLTVERGPVPRDASRCLNQDLQGHVYNKDISAGRGTIRKT